MSYYTMCCTSYLSCPTEQECCNPTYPTVQGAVPNLSYYSAQSAVPHTYRIIQGALPHTYHIIQRAVPHPHDGHVGSKVVDYRLPIVSNKLLIADFRLPSSSDYRLSNCDKPTNVCLLPLVPLLLHNKIQTRMIGGHNRQAGRHDRQAGRQARTKEKRQAGRHEGHAEQAGRHDRHNRQAYGKTGRCTENNLLY